MTEKEAEEEVDEEEAFKVLRETHEGLKQAEKRLEDLGTRLGSLEKAWDEGHVIYDPRPEMETLQERMEEIGKRIASVVEAPDDVAAEAARKVWDQTREELRADILKEIQEAQKAAIGEGVPLEKGEAVVPIADVEIDEEGLELDLGEEEAELVLDMEEEEGGD